MIKAVIFDCFGVLIEKSFWDVYKTAGGDVLKDDQFIEEVLYKANAGSISHDEFNSLVADRLSISVPEYVAIVEREETPNLPLFKYIKDKLKSKYKIALLSNVNRGVIDTKISPELRQVFDLEIISAEVGVQKPDPKIFEITIQKLGINYDEAVFVDDRMKYLAPAAELGIKTVQYTDFVDTKHEIEKLLNG
jgi:putative hydrolase of the HAD superfamily